MKNKTKQKKVQSKKLRKEKLAAMRDNKQITNDLYNLWVKENK